MEYFDFICLILFLLYDINNPYKTVFVSNQSAPDITTPITVS